MVGNFMQLQPAQLVSDQHQSLPPHNFYFQTPRKSFFSSLGWSVTEKTTQLSQVILALHFVIPPLHRAWPRQEKLSKDDYEDQSLL